MFAMYYSYNEHNHHQPDKIFSREASSQIYLNNNSQKDFSKL